jgi:hypothetical protein
VCLGFDFEAPGQQLFQLDNLPYLLLHYRQQHQLTCVLTHVCSCAVLGVQSIVLPSCVVMIVTVLAVWHSGVRAGVPFSVGGANTGRVFLLLATCSSVAVVLLWLVYALCGSGQRQKVTDSDAACLADILRRVCGFCVAANCSCCSKQHMLAARSRLGQVSRTVPLPAWPGLTSNVVVCCVLSCE